MACCSGAVLGVAAAAAWAQEALPDPTKPPPVIGASPAVAGQASAPSASSLQSVIISPARRAAIINGQVVKLGARLGNAKLVEVNEGSVVLRGEQGRQVLTLFPGVEIRSTESTMPVAKKKAGEKPASHAVQPKGHEGERK